MIPQGLQTLEAELGRDPGEWTLAMQLPARAVALTSLPLAALPGG